MPRLSALCAVPVLVCLGGAVPASAQVQAVAQAKNRAHQGSAASQLAAGVSQGDLHGTVRDDQGQALAGAVVSAVGATSAFAVSEQDGTFSLRNLPAGPYLLRAHLQGYIPTRGRIVQVNATARNVSAIALTRRAGSSAGSSTGTSAGTSGEPPVLEAGVGATAAAAGDAAVSEPAAHDHGEVAWRLRHLKRSVLKDADIGFIPAGDESVAEGAVSSGGALASSTRTASGWFADLPLNGQVNLLTRTSFERPQDLFSLDLGAPRGVTYVTLSAPTIGGDWSMRGAMTQGDLSSWILSGAYVRREPATHKYETGVSYGTQRYFGGNVDALAAVADGARNVGAVYAYDHWSISPKIDVSYGAKYARYDYLADRGLLSPQAAVSIAPVRGSSFRLHAAASRREVAPGADEFLPPSTVLWLPPERTFSPVAPGSALHSEQIDHVEVSVEHQWIADVMIGVRTFRENVDNQIVRLFGVSLPDTAAATVGHYYVASAGDFDARGWGVRLSRDLLDGVRASVDYTQSTADWRRDSPDQARLMRAAGSVVRTDSERIHDLTTSVESEVPATATRVFFLYKINSAFASSDSGAERGPSGRFELRVNQALPFLNFSSAQWEMLVAVRSLFSEDFRDASIYDELLVVRPPKRIVGGLTVRF